MKNENIILAILGGLFLLERGRGENAGIGKLYDSYTIRDGSRVDNYWRGLEIETSYLGRKDRAIKYYLDPQTAVEHFNLHGIEFGNWMNQEERANFMYATLVSLTDIAKAINVPHKKMGLKQRLQLAFGARGQGGFAAAFYQRVPFALINLTKTEGKGTFAHEYGHAIDENLHLLEYGKNGMMSGEGASRQTDPDKFDKNSTEYLFEKLFHTLYWNEDGSPTQFYKDQGERPEYWNRRREVWARTFERYIEIKFE
jgi:hypothetical protein